MNDIEFLRKTTKFSTFAHCMTRYGRGLLVYPLYDLTEIDKTRREKKFEDHCYR